MAFDQNALDSLRIERNNEPGNSGPGSLYKWIVIGVLVLAVAVGLYALLRNKAIEVETATAVQSSSGGSSGGAAVLNASGYVVARRQATVSSKVTGKVAEVLIEEGMAVKEGQLLARLDDTTTKPIYNLAQRQLDAVAQKSERSSGTRRRSGAQPPAHRRAAERQAGERTGATTRRNRKPQRSTRASKRCVAK